MKSATIHNQIQKYIADQLREGSKLYFIDQCKSCGGNPKTNILFEGWDSVRTEHHDRDTSTTKAFRYDIALLKGGTVIGAIEIRATSAVKSKKWYSLTDDKEFPWIEVNAVDQYFLRSDPWKIADPFPGSVTNNYHPQFNFCEVCFERMKAEESERLMLHELRMSEILKSDETIDIRFIDIYRHHSNYHTRDIVFLQTPRGDKNRNVFYVRLEDGRYVDEAFSHERDAHDAIDRYFNRLNPDEFFIDDPSDFDKYGNPPTCYDYSPQNSSEPNEYPKRYEFNSQTRIWEIDPHIMKGEDDYQNWGKRWNP